VTRDGSHLVVHFDGEGSMPGASHLVRNVLAITGGSGQVSFELAPGAGIRTLQLGGRVVIDVVDPGDPAHLGSTEPGPPPAPAPARKADREPDREPKPEPGRQPAPPERAVERQAPEPGVVKLAGVAPSGRSPVPLQAAGTAVALPAPEPPAPAPAQPTPTAEPPPRGRPQRTAADRPPRTPRPRTPRTGGSPASGAVVPLPHEASPQQEATGAPVKPPASAPAATVPPATVPMAEVPLQAGAPRLPVTADALPPQAADAPSPAATPGVAPRPAPPVADSAGHAMTLPFAATTGAAAFSRGGTAFAVFDERRAIDLSAIRDDPVLGGGTIQLLDGATVLRVRLPPGDELRLTRAPGGWTVAATQAPPAPAAIVPAPRGTAVFLAAPQPSRVVMVPDLDTGWNLLVGTQRQPGQGLPVQRMTPDYVLSPSWQGVVVEPRSDRLGLRVVQGGFLLEAPGEDLVAPSVQSTAQVLANAAALTRQFDLPDLPDAELQRRLETMQARAAGMPPLGRFQARRDVAQAMMALGLGAEAASVLKLAVADDPQHQDDPEVIALSGIAGVLADRDDAARALDDPRLPATDELTLWRAVRTARRPDGAAAAAPGFAATLPLLLSYPKPLRDRLLPLAAETMAQGGEPQAAARLIAQLTPPPPPPPKPADAKDAKTAETKTEGAKTAEAKPAAPPPAIPQPPPELDLARALLAQHDGHVDQALALYDGVARGRDQWRAALAAQNAVELKLASGRIDSATAADALSHRFLDWRADGHELALRLRAADLYADAGRWRPAIDLLRETAAQFPDDQPEVRKHQTQTFIAMLKDATTGRPGGVNSLDLISLAEENPDLIPAGPDGDTLAALLADRLVALDLPKRAIPALDRLMRAAPPGNARAGIGARLAKLRVEEGDGGGALATLDASGDPGIDPDLAEQRTLVAARAMAAQGDTPHAVAALSGLTSAAATDLRATLLAGAKDWPGAEAALTELVAKVIPPEGALSDAQQSLVIRLAGAAAQAGDEAALRDLGQRLGPRMQNQKLGQMLRLLTGGPVGGMLEMKQVAQDIALARSLPASLTALGGK
jgi:tetratricopeptide (TPR) repeat protein